MMNQDPHSLDELILNRRNIVLCGTGGVGKTTVSILLGVRAAVLGRRCVVATIDPARRLASALRVQDPGGEPKDISDLFPGLGKEKIFIHLPQALSGLTRFFRSLENVGDKVERLEKNTLFQVLSENFSGAQEIMSVVELERLQKDPRFDLVILDTPPVSNLESFFHAPFRVEAFMKSAWAGALLKGTDKILSNLGSVLDSAFLGKLGSFLSDFLALRTDVLRRLQNVSNLMRSKEISYIMVAGASQNKRSDVTSLLELMKRNELPFQGIILNRSLAHLEKLHRCAEFEEGERVLDHLLQRESEEFREFKMLARLPEVSRPLHDAADFLALARYCERDAGAS